jgi:hypothetical protein
LPDGFRIFGMNPLDMAAEPVEFFNVSEQGVVVNTNMSVAPKVTTTEVYAVSEDSAFCRGAVTDSISVEIVAFGFVYSSSVQPSLTMDTTIVNSGIVHATGSVEAFEAYLSGLTINTSYIVRAFATNAEGVTGYGAPKGFVTDGLYSFIFDPRTSFLEEPITDAIISVWPLPSGDTIQNAVGNYEFNLSPGEYGCYLDAPLSVPKNSTITVNQVNDPFYIILNDLQPVSVDVYTSDVLGQPIGGSYVELESLLDTVNGYTHEGGYVTLNAMPGVYNYTIGNGEMYIGSTGIIDVQNQAGQTFDLELQYANPREVVFMVIDQVSNKVTDAQVFLDGVTMDFYYQQMVSSDANGEAFFGVVPDADYSVFVTHNDFNNYSNNLSVTQATDTVEIVMPSLAK